MSMKKAGLAAVLMGFLVNLLFGGGSRTPSDIPAMINDGALVIDVRSVGEFSEGHIDGAINIPHVMIAKEIALHEKDKAKVIIVYCASGARSAVAKKSLESAGYTNVINGGGLQDMRKILTKG